jgi:hypothetical protein
MTISRWLGWILMATAGLRAQPAKPGGIPTAQPPQAVSFEQPDANRVHEELNRLLEHYPPTLRNVLAIDHSLLGNPAYLAPYPALQSFLNAHPEVLRDPEYYVGSASGYHPYGNHQDNKTPAERVSGQLIEDLGIFSGFALAVGLLTWLVRTLIDYRRWNRLTKIQTDVHTKILDRFSGNEELMAYIRSPAGARFLESAPIALDAGPRSVGAPLGRILWSVQAGLVLIAGGIGMEFVSSQVPVEAAQSIHAMGILGIALGCGFVVSAGASYFISQRLGLIDLAAQPAPAQPRPEPPVTLG